MKKTSLLLMLYLFGTLFTYAADNIYYVRESGVSFESRYLNVSNGANTTDIHVQNLITNDIENEVLFLEVADFNGDGRDDIYYIKKAANSGYYTHTAIDVTNNNILWSHDYWGEVTQIAVGDFLSDTKGYDICFVRKSGTSNQDNFLRFLEGTTGNKDGGKNFVGTEVTRLISGKFSDDNYDDVYFISESSIRKNGVIKAASSVSILWEANFEFGNGTIWGDILFVGKGNFGNNSITTQENIYYVRKSGDLNSRGLNVINGENGQQIWGKDLFTYNAQSGIKHEVQFVEIGDLSGDGIDDIYYILDAEDPSGNGASGYFQHTALNGSNGSNQLWSNTWYGKKFKNIYIGNYINDDNHMDIAFLRESASNDNFICYINGETGTTQTNGKNFVNKDVTNLVMGDYNGDGMDDLYYIYETTDNKRYNGIIKGGTDCELLWTEKYLESTGTTWGKILYCGNIGPVNKIMSNQDDKYKALETLDQFGNKIFPVGWYTTMTGLPADTIDEKILQLINYSPANFVLPYIPRKEECIDGTNYTPLYDYVNDISNPTSAYPKSTLVNLLSKKESWGDGKLPSTSDSAFIANFERLNSLNAVLGYYIGDDFCRVNDADATNQLWTQTKALHNYIKGNSNKLSYAAEAHYDPPFESDWDDHIKHTYDDYSNNFNDNWEQFDVPMIENFWFIWQASWSTQQKGNYMLFFTKQVNEFAQKELNNKNHSKTNFLYNSQATGSLWAEASSPEYYQSRYEMFNSIIMGAGGIANWAYYRTDPFDLHDTNENVLNNINSINFEIINMQKALINGKPDDIEVTCSKDGYDNDFQTYSFGKDLSDINYIIRKTDNTYFLITINNSPNTISNTRYYIERNGIIDNSLISEININHLGIHNDISISYNQRYRNGKKWNVFNVDYEPFEVKIFKIGNDNGNYERDAYSLTFLDSNSGEENNWDVQGSDGADKAHYFYIPKTSSITVTTCFPETNFDTKIEIFNADGTTTGKYNDDGGNNGNCSNNSYTSTLSNITLSAGEYYLVVDGYSGDTGNYKAEITINTSTLRSTKLTDDTTEDIIQKREPESIKELQVYPNPAKDYVILHLTSEYGFNYKLYNTTGKILISGEETSNKIKIDVSNLPNGIYLLVVNYKDQKLIKKISIR